MSLRPIGGIFLRLDSSGNLTIYDSSGTVIAKFIGGLFSSKINKSTPVTNGSINTTTSVTDVSTGFGSTITAQTSGNVLIIVTFIVSNNTAGANVTASVYTKNNATTIDAGGAAISGSFGLADAKTLVSSAANQIQTYALITYVSVTVGTPVALEIALRVSAGTGTIAGLPAQQPLVLEV